MLRIFKLKSQIGREISTCVGNKYVCTWGACFYKHSDNQLKFFRENKLANVAITKIEIRR